MFNYTYQKNLLKFKYFIKVGDELHHTGWNACASCKGDLSRKHGYLIVPSMVSGNIYVIDVLSDPHNPKIHAEIPG